MEGISVSPLPNPSKDYLDAVATGRCAIYCMGTGGATPVIAVIYGWTGAKKGSPEAARTDDLLTIVQLEFATLPPGHKMIAGDLNGTTEAFDTLTTMIKEQGWTDVGLAENICNSRPGQ